MRLGSLALTLVLSTLAWGSASAQTPSPAAPSAPADPLLSLSPQAAYNQALAPIEIVHRSVANWSNSEAASLAVAIQQAQGFCAARPASALSGADLVGLARLCALGQQWPAVLQATTRFLSTTPTPAIIPGNTAPSAPTPRAEALAFQAEAALNLRDPATAIAAARLLLSTEPYSPLTQQSTTGLLRYLQLIQTSDAINLAGERQDHLLPLLQAAPSAAAVLPPHELYSAALALPTLLQLTGNDGAAQAVFNTINAALPTTLSTDETTLIGLARRQYALLGSPLPEIPASLSLFNPTETPRVNRQFGAATILLVFPDWCAQCVTMAASSFMPFLTRHAGEDLHLYGLLAQPTPPPATAPPAATNARPHHSPAATASIPASNATPTAAGLLRGTPTLIVPHTLPLSVFAATDFPLLIITDHDGRIRFAQTAPENAFVPGSLVDQLAARTTELWPPPH